MLIPGPFGVVLDSDGMTAVNRASFSPKGGGHELAGTTRDAGQPHHHDASSLEWEDLASRLHAKLDLLHGLGPS